MTGIMRNRQFPSLSCLLLGLLCTAWPSEPLHGEEQARSAVFSNPVISGFAPDPSVVRVGEDFYLVTSTFEYFPGIPVYHSRDLVNWTMIGHALHDPSQVDLDSIDSSGGVHASTIRHHEGIFYVITTNVLAGNPINFIVTARDPRGPWSQAHVLEGAPGIDPSLFFDDDGRVWYTGNHQPPDPAFPGQAEIWLQELDLAGMRLIGERHYLWRGCCQGEWAEGPHIYKRDGWYYLLISEGGTSFNHAVAVAISRNVTGPYRNNPRNPILTHRHLGYGFPISGVGHADLVELGDGRWYALALGWRLIDGEHGILGRETFLAPVAWETEPYHWKQEKLTFPVVSPQTGRIELRFPIPFEGTVQQPPRDFSDEFDGPALGPEWNFRRTHDRPFHNLAAAPGRLRLQLQPGAIAPRARYSFAGVRQRHFRFAAETEMHFSPGGAGDEAGLAVIQKDQSAYLVTLSAAHGRLRLTSVLYDEKGLLAEVPFDGDHVHLRVIGDYLNYGFYWSADGAEWHALATDVDARLLSPAALKGFNYTGVYLGLYASANGHDSEGHADFEYFRYRPTAADRDEWFHRQQERSARPR